MSAPVTVEQAGGVGTLTLARPQVHNALDEATITALREGLASLAGEVRVLVLAAQGRSFCAGADLGYMKRAKDFGEDENLRDARELSDLFAEVRAFPGIVIAKVQGAAFGGGVGLVATADVVVASRRARFSLSEVKLGLVPAVISPFLIARVGEGALRAPSLLGYRMDGDEALRRGLVDRLVDEDELDAAVEAAVAEGLSVAPAAVRETKALFTRVAAGVEDPREETARCISRVRAGDEAQAGLAAFLEKRPPPWAGDPGGRSS